MNDKPSVTKTLIDIINPEILTLKAISHWGEMKNREKKQKGFVYNQVIKNQWNIEEDFDWLNEYHALDEIQKRMLLKRELINTYNALNQEDRELFHQYLEIKSNALKWHNLRQEEKRKIFQHIFKIY